MSSEASIEQDVNTPVPRQTSATHYFNHDNDYDRATSDAIENHAFASHAQHTKFSMPTLAQHELVSRALSPEVSISSWVSNDGNSNVDNSPASPRSLNDSPLTRPESALSSRPGTPLSAPSNLPIPSNPSSFPEDQQSSFPAPSLVMPSIQLSRKKPYTSEGRRIGKLRIMFCGDSGAGKTTLLRTIAHHSPDIVHYENTAGSEPGRPTTEINEVRASTQPYPSWKILGSSKQECSESIMERNICLVDTPGYGLSAEADDAIDPILRYAEDQFMRTNEILRDNHTLSDDDYLNLIAAPQGGFTHVDATVYCLTDCMSETDLTFIQKLSTYTTVIPVITKSDTMQVQQLESISENVLAQFKSPSIGSDIGKIRPFRISCADPEIEASVMMQDTYIASLVPSDLDALLATLYHQDHPAKLRHYTAQKFLAWRSKHRQDQSLVHLPDSDMTLLPSAAFTVSRIAEHTKREDKKTRLRIAAWASEMRNFQSHTGPGGDFINEKSAEWLMTTTTTTSTPQHQARRHGTGRNYLVDEADPMGLLRLRERWAKRVKQALKWCLDLGFTATGAFLCYHLWQRMTLAL